MACDLLKEFLTQTSAKRYAGLAYKNKIGGQSLNGEFYFKTNKNNYSVERPVGGKPATLEACFVHDADLHAFLFLEVL